MHNIEEQRRQNQALPEAEASTSKQRQAKGQFPANQESSSLSLLKLPNEVLYGIAGYLDLPERMIFALTCKFLMSLVSPERGLPRLVPPDKMRFLLALQRDIPKTFLCPWCLRLRRLNPKLNWRSQDHYIQTICEFSSCLPNSLWRNYHFESYRHIILPDDWTAFRRHGCIRFMDAHLIMNRHFYGPLHGISLRHLTRSVSFETELELDRCFHGLIPAIEIRRRSNPIEIRRRSNPIEIRRRSNPIEIRRRSNPNAGSAKEPTFDWIPAERPRGNGVWRFSLRYSPKIIDDKLYLARLFTFVGPNVPWDHLARLMNGIKPKVCNHMSCIIVMHPVAPMDSQTLPCGRAGEFDFEFSPAIKNNWSACGFNPGTGSCLISFS
ncbi:hypothetical protein MKX08_001155 [Trichoderma sp. CBMAI-0020]|nr:hypothetical protein MKX08_001155 [Trichoderma sp. CBMAI-0020]